ncbi:MAG TPA: LacI family DNA-binding transcriptional regulator [Arthrobacter sp.]|nr:LacI family DNA-binding transcriptional regulator [Arthrobacter sp.]
MTEASGQGRVAAPKGNRTEKSAVTIYDIAREAGVNPSTVSRALSKPGRISASTEKRIQDAARKLNYRVNPIARALPTGRTQTIGLIVADITNPMIFDVVRGAERSAGERDYTLVLAESEESSETELRAAMRLTRTVDGLVLASTRLADEQIQQLAALKPVVLINRELDGIFSVVADVDQGIAEAVRHLKQLGHSRVVYLAGPEQSWMSQRRLERLRQRCSWSNIQVDSIASTSPTVDGGRRAAHQVYAAATTAVIAYNDLLAIGLMQELQDAGVNVPRDLSIIGFDNIFGSDFTSPPLTTIKSPLLEAGTRAFDSLVEVLDGGTSGLATPGDDGGTARPVPLGTELIIRGSTGPAREDPASGRTRLG